jgi:hypothetical protein
MAVAISRFASTLDGIARRFIRDLRFVQIAERDLGSGQHHIMGIATKLNRRIALSLAPLKLRLTLTLGQTPACLRRLH